VSLALANTHTHTTYSMHIHIRRQSQGWSSVCNYNEHREADAAKQQQHSAAVDIFYTERASAAASRPRRSLILWLLLHQQKQTFSVCTLGSRFLRRSVLGPEPRSLRRRFARDVGAAASAASGGRSGAAPLGHKMHAVLAPRRWNLARRRLHPQQPAPQNA
jgi:hypothetical protein